MNRNTNEMNSDILSYAARLAGEQADQTLLAALCAAAESELRARLREGVSAEELGATFQIAAGVLAVSMYCAMEHPERVRDFKAGSVSVHYGGAESTPESLRTAAEALLSAYLTDRGFDFRGVGA